MKNVIELFVRKNGEVVLSETETGVAASVTRFLEINQQLERKLTDLSRQFDLIENAIETIDDIETRTRLEDSILRARESLSDALLKLSRQIGRIVGSASRESVIGTNRTTKDVRSSVAVGRKADVARTAQFGRD